MAERSLRGMSIGAKSLESDDNVDFAARSEVAYICPKGHRTILPFAEGAEIPDEWECRCGTIAHREGDGDEEANEIAKPTRTHWDMLIPLIEAASSTSSFWALVILRSMRASFFCDAARVAIVCSNQCTVFHRTS